MTSPGAERLIDFIESVRSLPLVWGSHDCLYFPLRAVEVQTGVWHDPPCYDTPAGALRCSRSADIVARFDALFTRCPHVPPVGSLVLTPSGSAIPWRGGVVVSDRAAFVSTEGLVFLKLRPDVELYWTVT